MSGVSKATHGFVSFTEVEPGEHQSYNEWHLFDHMPEQFPLPGIVWGQRWVLTPALRESSRAETPLDRVHYVTLYLLAEPVEQTIADFFELAKELRGQERFHLHRTSHLAGPLAVRECVAAPGALVSGEAIPYRPHRGVHVRVERDGSDASVESFVEASVEVDGVAGVWTFASTDASPPELRGVTATWCWLDGDLERCASTLDAIGVDDASVFTATLATIDPYGPFDWFDT